jgi:hypothetical protein
MARPFKSKADRRTDTLRIRLTKGERQQIDDAALTTGLESSTWARFELLGLAKKRLLKKPPVRVDLS